MFFSSYSRSPLPDGRADWGAVAPEYIIPGFALARRAVAKIGSGFDHPRQFSLAMLLVL
jgi:hypothetical protein